MRTINIVYVDGNPVIFTSERRACRLVGGAENKILCCDGCQYYLLSICLN